MLVKYGKNGKPMLKICLILMIYSKTEILEFCDRVIEKWNKNSSKNAKNILAMNAVKTSVLWTDDEFFAIWREIIAWTFELFMKMQ